MRLRDARLEMSFVHIVNGINTNTLAVIPTDNLTRSFPFTFEPKRPLYCLLSSFHIDEMRIYVTDSLGRPVNFNGIDWFMTLIPVSYTHLTLPTKRIV